MIYLTRLFLVVAAAGCTSTSADYGEPTATTTIELQQTGGFGGPQFARSVRIVGTTATYTAGSTTGTGTVPSGNIAQIIDALEDLAFLDLESDYTACRDAATDAENVTIDVELTAGDHAVTHYLGCSGGIFTDLKTLDHRIFDLSGYTNWSELD